MRLLRAPRLAVLTIACAALLALASTGGTVGAQTPPAATSTPSDAQALAVERQLLCPLCTNERLDVCAIAVCTDMKRVIRERLAAGSTPDDIILYFESRYGPRVRADLERSGFNLLLFGWVGSAVMLTGVAAALALYSMRRASQRRASTAATIEGAQPDDGWLDAQLREDEAGSTPPRT